MTTLARLLARAYTPAPSDISGAEASWRTFPWLIPLFVGSLLVALLLPNTIVGGVLIALWWLVVGLGWWQRSRPPMASSRSDAASPPLTSASVNLHRSSRSPGSADVAKDLGLTSRPLPSA
jgi:hypothetical protein